MSRSLAHSTDAVGSSLLCVDFAGEVHAISPSDSGFTIGRAGDIAIDDNPFLHRHLVSLVWDAGLWWAVNVGARLSFTVSGEAGTLHSWVAPGHRVPLVVSMTSLLFSAGDTTYEVALRCAEPIMQVRRQLSPDGDVTLGTVELSHAQLLTVLVLAEPTLRNRGTGTSELPSNAEAADKLAISLSAFNRRLDSLCEKLGRAGVRGLRGRPGELANGRRARVVEYAVAAGVVRPEHLALLHEAGGKDSGESL